MKLVKLSLLSAAALFGLWACSDKDETPEIDNGGNNNGGNTEQYDDAYYAANATVSSYDQHFAATDEGGTVTFGVSGGEVVVNVTIGTGWVVENDAEDWFGATASTSAGTLTVTAEENTDEDVRTGTLTLKTAADGIEFAVITVNQDIYDAPEISVSATEVGFAAVGESLTAEIEVDATYDWTAETEAEWLTLTQGDGSLTLTASDNETTEAREATVTLTAVNGIFSATATVAVTQDAHAYVTIGASAVNFPAKGGSTSVGYESNYEAIVTETPSWITAELSDGNLDLTIEANEAAEDREGVITLTAGDGAKNTASASVTVKQEGAEAAGLTITIDGDFSDWDAITATSSDGTQYFCADGASGYDSVRNLKATSDADYVYIYLEIKTEDICQQSGGRRGDSDKGMGITTPGPLWIFIDSDNDSTTGVYPYTVGGSYVFSDFLCDHLIQIYNWIDPDTQVWDMAWNQLNFQSKGVADGEKIENSGNWPTSDTCPRGDGWALNLDETVISYDNFKGVVGTEWSQCEFAMDRTAFLNTNEESFRLAGTIAFGVADQTSNKISWTWCGIIPGDRKPATLTLID